MDVPRLAANANRRQPPVYQRYSAENPSLFGKGVMYVRNYGSGLDLSGRSFSNHEQVGS